MKRILKSKNGITLIALVVTIVVLLILAVVSISMLQGENGIIGNAQKAKDNNAESEIVEKVQLAYNAAIAEGNGILIEQNLRIELEKEFGNNYDLSEDASTNEWVISVDEIERLRIREGTGTIAPKLPTTLGSKPYFPSDSFKQLEGTNLTNGLVITDKAENEEVGNEYVWIEIPSTAVNSSATGGPNYSGVSGEDDYTNIATALRNYCTVDKNGQPLIGTDGNDPETSTCGCTDEWYDGCGISNSEYLSLYNNMLKSIYKNGGFWIGRYEAGVVDDNIEVEDIIPLSKVDLFPIVYLNCGETQQIAAKVANKGSYNSSLLFGIQWDLVIRYLSNKGVSTSDLTGNSESWGNYDYTYELNQSTTHGLKWEYGDTNWSPIADNEVHSKANWSTTGPVLYTTGASTRNMKNNIYDFAGNTYEWTLEKSIIYSNSPCSIRGGSFYSGGLQFASSYRSGYSINYRLNYIRF